MLIEHLARLGRPFLARAQEARQTLLDIPDVTSPQAVGFFCNVMIVEVDVARPDGPPAAWDLQDWTSRRVQGNTEVVEVKPDVAAAAPFTIPRGGNPRKPQGRYPVPAYIVYEGDMATFQDPDPVLERYVVPVPFELARQVAESHPGRRILRLVDLDAYDSTCGFGPWRQAATTRAGDGEVTALIDIW